MNKIIPEIICQINNGSGILGYLVIDSIINNNSWGGIRTVQDLTLEELIRNARTMTMKYGFLGLPVGGAKAGVVLRSENREIRRELFRTFGERLSPLIKNRIYLPGLDLGTELDDLKELEKGSGVNLQLDNWKDVSHIYTSWTIYVAAESAKDIIGLKKQGIKIAIDGFGKVGSAVARIFSDRYKIVAVSNRHGAIYNENGLNISLLLQLREIYKDEFIFRYTEASRIDRSELFYLPVDILIPAGRYFNEDELIAKNIKAPIICPGVNEPLTEKIEKQLFEKGQICFPDFMCNSGGVLGSLMRHYAGDERIKKFILDKYKVKVFNLLLESAKRNIPVGRLAREYAYKRIELMKSSNKKNFPDLKAIVPKFFKKPFVEWYFDRRLNIKTEEL
jgi:glutamate dehydrogenase (NAD(P)+)